MERISERRVSASATAAKLSSLPHTDSGGGDVNEYRDESPSPSDGSTADISDRFLRSG